jgi:hypothetical protein
MPLDNPTLNESKLVDLFSTHTMQGDSKIFFPVVLRDLFAEKKVYNHDTDTVELEKLPASRQVGVFRTDTDDHLGSHTSRDTYTLVDNHELIVMVEEKIREYFNYDVLDQVEILDHIAFNGSTCMREYRFPRIKTTITTNRHQTEVIFRVIVVNNYDGKQKLKVIVGNIDTFCSNGIITGDYAITGKKRTSGLSLGNFGSILKQSFEHYMSSVRAYQGWAETTVDPHTVESFFNSLNIPERRAENLFWQFTEEASVRGLNLWSVVSAMTQYGSHDSERFGLRNTNSDHSSVSLLKRQTDVTKWINSSNFKALRDGDDSKLLELAG